MADNTACEAGACIDAGRFDTADGPVIRIRSDQSHTAVQATVAETAAFFAQVKAGKWDHLVDDGEEVATHE